MNREELLEHLRSEKHHRPVMMQDEERTLEELDAGHRMEHYAALPIEHEYEAP